MSSFVAHALVGASCLVLARPRTFQHALPLVLAAAFLGLSPDIDYILLWTTGWRPDPRITHSLAFVSLVSLLLWSMVRVISTQLASYKLLLIFFVAAVSHLVLDALVGVTQNPIVWPFMAEGFSFPYGVLPSAGKPNPFNYYFWRNLLIELSIILPVLGFGYLLAHKQLRSWLSWKGFIGLCIFVVALYISVNLSR